MIICINTEENVELLQNISCNMLFVISTLLLSILSEVSSEASHSLKDPFSVLFSIG
jgi:hypothetical protein